MITSELPSLLLVIDIVELFPTAEITSFVTDTVISFSVVSEGRNDIGTSIVLPILIETEVDEGTMYFTSLPGFSPAL